MKTIVLAYIEGLYAFAKQLEIEDQLIWTGEYASDSDEASLYLRAAMLVFFRSNMV